MSPISERGAPPVSAPLTGWAMSHTGSGSTGEAIRRSAGGGLFSMRFSADGVLFVGRYRQKIRPPTDLRAELSQRAVTRYWTPKHTGERGGSASQRLPRTARDSRFAFHRPKHQIIHPGHQRPAAKIPRSVTTATRLPRERRRPRRAGVERAVTASTSRAFAS